ncbi:MAG: hypothetical protein A2077_00155 [Nitrospirae bacterium GWC2_46_6]|nr:MAG: hypothetical protein A2077_00155 [Nitrospirae bacterium GWC2_46_6]HCL81095.1 hypothetical protein [Nitrospiraceae bacterium]
MENITQEKMIEILKKVHFFSGFTDEELKLISGFMQWIKFEAGDIIIKEGMIEKTFFLIIKGKVSIKKKTWMGSLKKAIDMISAGQIFGEMAFITGKPRTADIIAEEETYVLKFSAEEMLKDETKYAHILVKFYKKFAEALSERLAKADRELVNLSM